MCCLLRLDRQSIYIPYAKSNLSYIEKNKFISTNLRKPDVLVCEYGLIIILLWVLSVKYMPQK